MSAAFDTLSVARDLEAAGIERAHAEAIAQVVHHGDERAATKADLDQLRAATKADLDTAIAALRAELKADTALLRADLDTITGRLRADLDTAAASMTTRLDGMRSELGTMRWTIGLLAAFVFAIGLRIFGLL